MPRAKTLGSKAGVLASASIAAVVDIDGNDGAFFTVERFVGGLLHLAVQGQMDRVARHVGDFVQHAHAPAERIDLDLLAAMLAAQNFFPAPFKPGLANLIADERILALLVL